MGASAGKIVGDERQSTGVNTSNAGKNSDDDEDFNWEDYEEEGGGGGVQAGNILKHQQTIDEIRIIEQAKQNLAHQRHKRLHARQEPDGDLSEGAADTVGKVVDTVSSKISDISTTTTPIVPSPTLDLSSLSIVTTSSLVPSLPTDIKTSLPIGSSLQTLLSSTPPPSPAQTSSGMTIPPTTTSSPSRSPTTPPPSHDATNAGPSTTITSYWTSLTFRNNGTSSSNTRSSTVTVDGTVIVFAFPTNSGGSNFFTRTGNSSTRSSASASTSSSTSSSNSTTTSTSSPSFPSPLSTGLWASGTDVAGGAGVGYVTPTGDAATASSATPTGASGGSNSPPVSPSLLGGVLGGVAGLAFVLVAILYLIRRHRRQVAATAMDDAGYGGPLGGDGDMAQRSSMIPFALTGRLFAKESGASRVSQSSEAPTVPSETGFYKVSGRKLPPVLGGPRPGYGSTRSAGGSSFYPDEDGGSGTIASTPSVAGPSRYSSMTAASASPTTSAAPVGFIAPVPVPVSATHPHTASSSMAPPPPRIQEEAAESDIESAHKLPRPPPFPRQLSAISVGSVGKDGVGRSLPSHDGSRASRFTEDIV